MAQRRYAAQLEKAWEITLQRVETCLQKLDGLQAPQIGAPRPDIARQANGLSTVWTAPASTMRTRQRLVRALITEIVANIDEMKREMSIGRQLFPELLVLDAVYHTPLRHPSQTAQLLVMTCDAVGLALVTH